MNHRKFIDFLTVLSCLAVVMLHTNNVILQHPSGPLLWKTAFWHNLFIFGAPAFFMISGGTLMEYRERYGTVVFFLKRLRRAVIPFIAWSLIAFAVRVCLNETDVSFKTLLLLPLKICSCDYLSIYWFFMSVFMGYLFMPVMSLMSGRLKVIAYVLSVWFLLESLYPFFFRALGLSVCSRVSFPFVGGAVFYMLLGYLLYKIELGKYVRWGVYALGIIVFSLCYCRDVFHWSRLGGNYWSPPCIIYSSAVFVFFRNCKYDKMPSWLTQTIDWIKPHTLGVYLMHGFVTDIAAIVWKWPVDTFAYRMVCPFLLIMVCVMISRVMKRVPFVRTLV